MNDRVFRILTTYRADTPCFRSALTQSDPATRIAARDRLVSNNVHGRKRTEIKALDAFCFKQMSQ